MGCWSEIKSWLVAVGGISGFFFVFFSAAYQPVKPSLLLVGSLCGGDGGLPLHPALWG